MRLITTLGRRYVVSLFLASALTGAAQTTVSGQPGVVVSQGEMNFSELAAREAKAPARPAVRVFHPKFHTPKPTTLPVGTPIHFTPEPLRRAPIRAATAPQPRSPALSASFLALLDDGTAIPPDTQGTVGPNHLMVTLNSQVLVQFRDGSTAKPPVSLTAFWQAAGGVRDTTDPRVVFDPYNNRWIVSTSGNFLTTTAGVLVGVSATSDPTGTWFLYNIAADPAKKNFCDFPILGFNRNWVVINCNMFANAAPHNYAGGQLFVINKSGLYSNAKPPTVFTFDTQGDSNVTPASTYDNNLNTEYLLEEYSGNLNGLGYLRLWAVTGSVTAPSLASLALIATEQTWDEVGSPQLEGFTTVDPGDAGLGNVIYRNGTLWTTHTIFFPPINQRSSIQWWQVNTDANILQRGVITGSEIGVLPFYPTIAVNKSDDVLIAYSGAPYGGFVSAYYSFRSAADPPSTVDANGDNGYGFPVLESLLKAGEASYNKDFGSGDVRWGDYSNTAVDPIDDLGLWTIQEYAASGPFAGGTWGTWWGAIPRPGPLATLQIVIPFSPATAGNALDDLEVFSADASRRYVAGFTGTIHFTSSDPRAVLPADYTFTAADKGFHHFSGATFFHAGQVGITVTDTANVLPPHTMIISVNPGPTTVFLISYPNPVTAGATNNFSVTAQDGYQNTTPGYFGMVSFSSTDPQATLPASYTFAQFFDNGTHTFAATLRTAGSKTVFVADTATPAYGSAVVQVNPAVASQLVLSAPANVTRTRPFIVSVTAKDPFNNLATGYTGTVQFSSTDAAASKPALYTFTAADQGRHGFPITLSTLGPSQPDLTVTDMANSFSASASINVLQISGSVRRVRVRVGQQFNALLLANFSQDTAGTPTATIDWGDGVSSAATLSSDGSGGFNVLGDHQYLQAPRKPIMIQVPDTGSGALQLLVQPQMWPRTESH